MARTFVLGPNAARELKRLIRGNGGVSRRDVGSGALAFDSEYVPPFTVQWAASANDGEGSWIIWLPGGELVVDGLVPVDVVGDLEAVGGDYPAGWYLLDNSQLDALTGGTLYLTVERDTEGTPTAAFSASAAVGGFSIAVCRAAVDSDTGERKVKQLLSSALAVFSPGSLAVSHAISASTDNVSHQSFLSSVVSLLYNGIEISESGGTVNISQVVRNVLQGDGDSTPVLGAHTDSGIVLNSVVDPDTNETIGVEIDLRNRETGDTFAVRTLAFVDSSGSARSVKILGTDDIELPAGVRTLNDEDGDMDIVGGPGIVVETDGKTIRISYDENKTATDPDPNAQDPDPCEHPGDGGVPDGGVPAGGGRLPGGGPEVIDPRGGVPAGGGGESHPGDDNCNC